jgi:hypothetical protein
MMDLLQWAGFACIVGGYWMFARSKWWGAAISIVGALPLACGLFLLTLKACSLYRSRALR